MKKRTVQLLVCVGAVVGALAIAAVVAPKPESYAAMQRRLNPHLASVMTDDPIRNDCIIRTPNGIGPAKAAQICDVARSIGPK